jgi:hypothetical protein
MSKSHLLSIRCIGQPDGQFDNEDKESCWFPEESGRIHFLNIETPSPFNPD